MLFSIRLVSEDAKPRDMRRILKFLESQQSYLDFLVPRVEAPNRSLVEGSAVVLTWLQRMSCSFLLPLPSWNRYLSGLLSLLAKKPCACLQWLPFSSPKPVPGGILAQDLPIFSVTASEAHGESLQMDANTSDICSPQVF